MFGSVPVLVAPAVLVEPRFKVLQAVVHRMTLIVYGTDVEQFTVPAKNLIRP
jgi:hypothetical protein